MGKKADSPEQVVKLLRGVDAASAAGRTVEEACREPGVATSSYHRWRNQYRGLPTDEVKRVKELGKENERLKRIVADLTLDKRIRREAARGSRPARPGAARSWPGCGRPSTCRRGGRAAPWGCTARGSGTSRRPTPPRWGW